jgi:hypothetical protein
MLLDPQIARRMLCDVISAVTEFMVRVFALEDAIGSPDYWLDATTRAYLSANSMSRMLPCTLCIPYVSHATMSLTDGMAFSGVRRHQCDDIEFMIRCAMPLTNGMLHFHNTKGISSKLVRWAFPDRNLHSRMPLDPTYVRLTRTCV